MDKLDENPAFYAATQIPVEREKHILILQLFSLKMREKVTLIFWNIRKRSDISHQKKDKCIPRQLPQ